MSTLEKMQRALELISEVDRLNEYHKHYLKDCGILLSLSTVSHYENRIAINEAIKERLKQYYNNRLTELKPL